MEKTSEITLLYGLQDMLQAQQLALYSPLAAEKEIQHLELI